LITRLRHVKKKKKDIYGQEKNIEEYDMYYRKINYIKDGSNRRINPRTLTVFCVISDSMSGKNFPSSCKALETLILTLHGRGRQDALKFASLMRHNYMRKTAELDTQFFIDPGTNQPTVSGLILAVQLNSRLSSASQICLILDYM
jgi:hypothetical protein